MTNPVRTKATEQASTHGSKGNTLCDVQTGGDEGIKPSNLCLMFVIAKEIIKEPPPRQ
ncbi:hypothetical protein ACMXYO_03635 [Neptuniibacter sp. QD37_6]|uniref:hypothetical protein n=1 Tax=Neptuniibacter sp. QD37_6 TaxID=3398210 RepID=UPI0039F5CD23